MASSLFNTFRNLSRKIFSDPKGELEEIKLSDLEHWLNCKISESNFNSYFLEYFRLIQELKEQLHTKLEELKLAEIPSEHQKIEVKIKNLVLGHRNNYVREMEIFSEKLDFLNLEDFSTLSQQLAVLEFNQKFDLELERLAQKTMKNYQASQHLFFKETEEVFKVIGRLNSLAKEFKEKKVEEHLIKLTEIKRLKGLLNESLEKKGSFEKEIAGKEKQIQNRKEEVEEMKNQLQKLRKSREYQQFLEQGKQKEEIERKIRENEDKIYSFFSKLNKPLKKYDRITFEDNQLIKNYGEDSIKALKEDSGLKIKIILLKLKERLKDGSLTFEEKHKGNYLELIAKAETTYLDDLTKENKILLLEQIKILNQIDENETNHKICSKEKEINSFQEKLLKLEKELNETINRGEKINLEQIKAEIESKIKERFKIWVKVNLPPLLAA